MYKKESDFIYVLHRHNALFAVFRYYLDNINRRDRIGLGLTSAVAAGPIFPYQNRIGSTRLKNLTKKNRIAFDLL